MGGETTTESETTLGEILDDEEDDQDPVVLSDADEVDGADAVVGDAGTVDEPPVRWTATAATSNGDSGNGRAATSRRVAPVPTAPARSRGWRSAAIVGLVIAGLLSAAIVLLWGQADDASSDAKSARTLVASAADASARVDVLERTIADLQKQLAAMKTASDALQVSVGGAAPAADVNAKVTALTARADQLAACVNTYMDAVATWSQNPTASTFTYHHC